MTRAAEPSRRSHGRCENGWFHSGDLTVVDRKLYMIKTGGDNVASREVEEVMYQHPAVAEVAVFGVSHPRWIEAVAVVVVLKQGEQATADDIGAYCRDKLAGFKAPKHVFLADALPKNASGKILKRELREQYADAVCEDTAS